MENKIKTNLKQWTSEPHVNQICFLELLSFGRVITALEKNVESFILQAMKHPKIASATSLINTLFRILDKNFQK